ncbi:hypothetical protein ACLKA6_004611 [Drosophila palustris]
MNFNSGGVAILIRNNIRHMALQPIQYDQIQCAPVAIKLESGDSLILAPIYCPPQPTWTEQQFLQLLEHLHKLCNNSSNSSNYNRPGLLLKQLLCHLEDNCTTAITNNNITINIIYSDGATDCLVHKRSSTVTNISSVNWK